MDSFLESCANIAVGFVVSLLMFTLCTYIFKLHTNFGENTLITLIITVTSLARQYLIRRFFNGRSLGEVFISKLHS